MKMPLELRYALLISLGMLLWLALEAVLGFHDKYIAYHPYVTMLALAIPIVFSRMAVRDKKEVQGGTISFKQALITGLVITVLAAILAVPVQLVFHYWINPHFFEDMINYAVVNGKSSAQQAAMFFNLTSYIIQSVVGTLIFGSVVALVVALLMRTKK